MSCLGKSEKKCRRKTGTAIVWILGCLVLGGGFGTGVGKPVTVRAAEESEAFVPSEVPAPEFSVEAGFYEEAFELVLTAPEGTEIYYTLDGSEPDMDNPLLTTFGPYLNKCDPNFRKDIIDRLIDLQTGNEDIKDYKVIDEDMLDDVLRESDDEMER